MTLHPMAADLMTTIEDANPHVAAMLSARGRAIYFPFGGILGQAAEAKGKRINATIGIALEDDGRPLVLQALQSMIELDGRDAFTYAPSFGKPKLREMWRQMLREKNPSLHDTAMSLPVVTVALTHALSMAGYLFLDPGDDLLCADLFWGNYRLLFEHQHGANIRTFPTFDGDGLDVAALKQAVTEGAPRKRVLLLNFPNNPTGYTPTVAEADAIVETLTAAAEAGNDLVVLIDDAYFGLVYEDGVLGESIFARLADAHPRLLAVKIDGATKEDYVWGFRVGFITYGVKGATPKLFGALEAKTAGAIRGNVSNAPNLSQSLLAKAFQSADYPRQKKEKFATLQARFHEVRRILDDHPEYAERFVRLPFNSGYFMCVRPLKADADAVRKRLLEHYDTGVIATSGLIRVAFSSTPRALLADLFANLYAACGDVEQGD
ncbi:MAG: aminotransferase class I/II-fold pyridoxal phosphate-dependent enzyme [Myxococcales bacterium]|nr:aminotransferase class I/II-fold pyridoxal phosphate-dependent enzyme [Myxococcales bacterium]